MFFFLETPSRKSAVFYLNFLTDVFEIKYLYFRKKDKADSNFQDIKNFSVRMSSYIFFVYKTIINYY